MPSEMSRSFTRVADPGRVALLVDIYAQHGTPWKPIPIAACSLSPISIQRLYDNLVHLKWFGNHSPGRFDLAGSGGCKTDRA